jgi:hypothetical protein
MKRLVAASLAPYVGQLEIGGRRQGISGWFPGAALASTDRSRPVQARWTLMMNQDIADYDAQYHSSKYD